jgi:hypothetical protein
MMRELKSLSPTIIERTLNGIYYSLIQSSSGDLFSKDKMSSFSIDSLLTQCRAFLVNLVEDESSNKEMKELAVKIIVLIGNVRCSAEDLLFASNLIEKNGLSVNYDQEINRISMKAEKTVVTSTKGRKIIVD